MRSIQRQLVALCLAGILLSIVTIGGISLFTIQRKSDKDAVRMMSLTCAEEAMQINSTLRSIRQSVDLEAAYARKHLQSVSEFLEDEPQRADYTEDLERMFTDIANETNGAVSYYVRYNAELVPSTQGFLYTRQELSEPFSEITLTDISLYDPSDDEHVGWYYIPMRNGMPTWMLPYFNRNLGIYMISYVIPLYAEETFIGVIGMDVNFQVIIDQLRALSIYSGGYAALSDAAGMLLYHPVLDYGTTLESCDPSLAGIAELLYAPTSGDALIPYQYQGERKYFCFSGLDNGMRLLLTARAAEINEDRNQLMLNVSIAAFFIGFLLTCGAVWVSQRITRPLQELTEVAEEVANGNLNVTLPRARSQEIGTLIDAYQRTVGLLREQIDYIDSMANHDSLTGLWNQRAYHAAVAELGEHLQEEGLHFGIVMLDVNDLKKINDRYGHEYGDQYLKAAAETLKAAFAGEQIFRVGGDEFAVLLKDGSVEAAEAGIRRLLELQAASVREHELPWERIFVAHGTAFYDAARDHDVKDVLDRADAAMYEEKRRMKAEAETTELS